MDANANALVGGGAPGCAVPRHRGTDTHAARDGHRACHHEVGTGQRHDLATATGELTMQRTAQNFEERPGRDERLLPLLFTRR